jgi:hypothetical protein
MKTVTLSGIAKTAECMGITLSLIKEGLMCDLSHDGNTISSLIPWLVLDTSSDPHGRCAIIFGNMFNAMKVAQGVDE